MLTAASTDIESNASMSTQNECENQQNQIDSQTQKSAAHGKIFQPLNKKLNKLEDQLYQYLFKNLS